MEIAISDGVEAYASYLGWTFLAIALIFVWRSFYKMRIPKKD